MKEEHALEKLVGFHGHMCTGLALGVRAVNMALRELEAEEGADLVVAVETDTCSVDAIQVLTGCTFGNGKLYYRDHAKNAYTFWRSDGRAIRLVAQPESFRTDTPGFWDVFARVQRGTATEEERTGFFALQQSLSQRVLGAPEEELFGLQEVSEPPPARPLITPQVSCEACGESTVPDRTQERQGQLLCIPCAQLALQKSGGDGPQRSTARLIGGSR